jgi:hypothetical protein
MKRVVHFIFAAALLASASPAAAQIFNGGFEDGTFGDGSVRQVRESDSRTLPGWTVDDNPLFWYTNGYESPIRSSQLASVHTPEIWRSAYATAAFQFYVTAVFGRCR